MSTRKSDNPGIQPADSVHDAGKKVLIYHFNTMVEHESKVINRGDTDAIHDMRVSTRRMRVALDLFGECYGQSDIKPIRKGLRKTGKFLGRVRDLDVFIEKSSCYLDALIPKDRVLLNHFVEDWRFEREVERRKLVSYLGKSGFIKFKHRLIKFLYLPGDGTGMPVCNPPISRRLPELIDGCMQNVIAFDLNVADLSVEHLHALRIALKQLRYSLEFFKFILGKDVRPCISSIKNMQTHLGDLNDSRDALSRLESLLDKIKTENEKAKTAEDKCVFLIEEYVDRTKEELFSFLDSFPELWEDFTRGAFTQNLHNAISSRF